MYVCICNALTDRDFREAAARGAAKPAQAFRALGETPQCGRCLTCVREVLDETRALEMAAQGMAAE